jgi:hypothetical protein
LNALTFPRCIPKRANRLSAFSEEPGGVGRILGTHPGMIDDAFGVAQRPARIAMCLTLSAIADVAAIEFTSLLRSVREWPKALLERCLLAARMDGSAPTRRCLLRGHHSRRH